MHLKGTFLLIITFFLLKSSFPQIPIGNWREHLAYQKAFSLVATSDKIYGATPYALFSVDLHNNNIERISKINGLSEVGISSIGLDDHSGKLVVVYTNSNIDILFNKKVFNIDDVLRKDIPGDKKIYNIYCYRDKAYLSTGFGIVVIDVNKYEVKDTYLVGSAGNQVKVNSIAADLNFFYAASEEGLKKATIDNINLADYRNWKQLSGIDGLSPGACQQVCEVQDKIIVQKNDSLFVWNGTAWKLFYSSNYKIIHASSSSGKLILAQQLTGADSRVLILNADGTISKTILQPARIIDPQQGIIVGEDTWIADMETGLVRVTGNNFQQYQPDSPLSIATGEMTVNNNSLWVTAGTVTDTWVNTFSKNGFYQFVGNEWLNYNDVSLPAINSLYDIVTVAADPSDNTLWAGSFGGGLLQFKSDHSVNILNKNSPVQPSISSPDKYQVAGLALDTDRNLWIANYGAAQNLVVRKADNSWRSFVVPFSHSDNAISQIILDDYNQKWIVSPNGNGLFCFNHGTSIDNPGDDNWKYYRSGTGNGNLPDNNVLCIAKDKNSFIWVGTMKGIGIIQCAQQVFSVQGCEAILPIVQQDNFAGYLFRDEQVQAIAVDGADRKWIGTKNGVWLLSADGDKTLYHFKQDDSPLLNNDVKKIAIDDKTGEVFFATAQGICSFRSTATEGGTSNENILVFPNPVPPGYSGSIAIKGLVNNALVKITELDGRLVFQTRANGGQAVWNGLNYLGRKISTGVYLVLVSDDARKEKMVTKIIFVAK
ncbi:MAG: two-component regulator propeller domain-containing protein [Chitinophagaceae bacterium]